VPFDSEKFGAANPILIVPHFAYEVVKRKRAWHCRKREDARRQG
jgi:hypothetical protein